MLVLTRKVNECIVIDSTIEVRVLKTQNNKVTIGLTAPVNVSICRSELQPFGNNIKEDLGHVCHI
jgi:carbon storage regulator CsrA